MPDTPTSLSELIKINDQNVADIDGISDLLQEAPLFAQLMAIEASNGTQHKYLKETKAPVVGFRAANDGREHDSSQDDRVTIDLQILDATFHVDQAVANEFDTKPYGKGRAAYMARDARRHLRASFKLSELQVINGQAAQAPEGFEGLRDASTIDDLDDPMVVNAGGTGSDLTSVYLIRSVPEETDFLLVTGDGGKITVGEEFQQQWQGTTGTFPAYVQPIQGWLGVQFGTIHSVGRICNINDANPLDDDLIAKAIKRFPTSRKPTHLVMNGDALEMLRASRTATNPTGAPAPWPDSAFNTPIVETDSVLSTEDALTAPGP